MRKFAVYHSMICICVFLCARVRVCMCACIDVAGQNEGKWGCVVTFPLFLDTIRYVDRLTTVDVINPIKTKQKKKMRKMHNREWIVNGVCFIA